MLLALVGGDHVVALSVALVDYHSTKKLKKQVAVPGGSRSYLGKLSVPSWRGPHGSHSHVAEDTIGPRSPDSLGQSCVDGGLGAVPRGGPAGQFRTMCVRLSPQQTLRFLLRPDVPAWPTPLGDSG